MVRLEPEFCSEIEEYLKNCLNNNEDTIDMSDALILDYGAKLVATTAAICDNLQTIKLQQCRITDQGAIELFRELKDHQTLKLIDLSYNPITETCFEALVELLTENDQIVVNMCMNDIRHDADITQIAKFTEMEAGSRPARLFISNDKSLTSSKI